MSDHISQLMRLRSGDRCVLASPVPPELHRVLVAVGVDIVTDGPAEVGFLYAENTRALERLHDLRDQVTSTGSIWVLWPEQLVSLGHRQVVEAGLAAGLEDVKAVGLSSDLAALQFVRRYRR
ncbi:MAG: hypothetical protein QMC79_09130 [Anaerosomatales bacterium]|nr:hypothetical protein [Anaerosomatales bacterium]